MKLQTRRLVRNKKEDWLGGAFIGVAAEGDAIRLDGATRGIFCMRSADSGENGFAWRRVTLDAELPRDTLIATMAYASDSKTAEGIPDLDEFFEKEADGSRAELIKGLFGDPIAYSSDFYVNKKGRYLWLIFTLISTGEGVPGLRSVSLWFPGDHMTYYLPAIYGGSFTYRFLSIFDSFFTDMEQSIYRVASRFDFERATGDMLAYLASWVNVDERDATDEQLRERIRTALSDCEDMYTPRGIARTVERLTGEKPVIIEHFQVSPNLPGCPDPELYKRLYGESPYKFFVLLSETVFSGRSERELFLERMRDHIPANTEMETVLLKRCIQLDWHTYLGMNSYVGSYVPVSIDENKTIHYDSMIGGDAN